MLISTCCDAPAWNETDICSKCKEHADFEHDNEYDYYHEMAVNNNWSIPSTDLFSDEVWLRYWTEMEAYHTDKSRGRPIVPHRTGKA